MKNYSFPNQSTVEASVCRCGQYKGFYNKTNFKIWMDNCGRLWANAGKGVLTDQTLTGIMDKVFQQLKRG